MSERFLAIERAGAEGMEALTLSVGDPSAPGPIEGDIGNPAAGLEREAV